jgi:hypothetical protein
MVSPVIAEQRWLSFCATCRRISIVRNFSMARHWIMFGAANRSAWPETRVSLASAYRGGNSLNLGTLTPDFRLAVLPKLLPTRPYSLEFRLGLTMILLKYMVPRVGFELTAYRLRSGCSTAELPGPRRSLIACSAAPAKPFATQTGAGRTASTAGRLPSP